MHIKANELAQVNEPVSEETAFEEVECAKSITQEETKTKKTI